MGRGEEKGWNLGKGRGGRGWDSNNVKNVKIKKYEAKEMLIYFFLFLLLPSILFSSVSFAACSARYGGGAVLFETDISSFAFISSGQSNHLSTEITVVNSVFTGCKVWEREREIILSNVG
jgi:hypothetical protein